MVILFACSECGEDHLINSKTKTVKHFVPTEDGYSSFQAVSYEEDTIPEDIAKSFKGFKWNCTLCGEEMEEEYYTVTNYYV